MRYAHTAYPREGTLGFRPGYLKTIKGSALEIVWRYAVFHCIPGVGRRGGEAAEPRAPPLVEKNYKNLLTNKMEVSLSQKKRKRSQSVVVVQKKARKTKRKAPAIIPDKIVTTLSYADVVSRTTVGGLDDFRLNLNSIFDPEATGAGHQPLGRDEWSAFYNKYRVLSASWEVWYSSNGESSMVSVFPSNSSTTSVGLAQHEHPYSQTKLAPGVFTLVGQVDPPTYFRGRIGMAKLTGLTSAQYQDRESYGALFSADPAEILQLHIASRTVAAGNQSATVAYKIKYRVEMSDRIQLLAS